MAYKRRVPPEARRRHAQSGSGTGWAYVSGRPATNFCFSCAIAEAGAWPDRQPRRSRARAFRGSSAFYGDGFCTESLGVNSALSALECICAPKILKESGAHPLHA